MGTENAAGNEGADRLTTRTGVVLNLRSITAGEEPTLARFFEQLTTDDLRFRFLSAVNHVSADSLKVMTAVDHDHSETFLAFGEQDELVAVAMLAGDAERSRAEAAISIRPEFKNMGIGWCLLEYLVRYADTRGYASIEAVESRNNRAAIGIEQEMGFVAEPVEDEPGVMVLRRHLR